MVNTYLHDDRRIQEIPRNFALEMGLATCTWDFAFHIGKPQVPCKLYFNGLSKVGPYSHGWGLGLGTWDLCELALRDH